MNVMRRIKSIASGRSSVSDPVILLFSFLYIYLSMCVCEMFDFVSD